MFYHVTLLILEMGWLGICIPSDVIRFDYHVGISSFFDIFLSPPYPACISALNEAGWVPDKEGTTLHHGDLTNKRCSRGFLHSLLWLQVLL